MGSYDIKKILLVCDEGMTLSSLTYALKTEGVEVTSCNEIEVAVNMLIDNYFDLVIADVRMLGAHVVESMRLLKFIKKHYCTEVIIISGYGWGEIEAEACRCNSLGYFSKPLQIKELLMSCAKMGIPVKKHLYEGI